MLRKFARSSILEVVETPEDLTRKTAERLAQDHELPAGFTPLPGKIYLTTRAISNRVNANYDYFAAAELLGAYDGAEPHNEKFGYRTFVGKPVFLDHNNTMWDDPRGRIIASHVFEDEPGKHGSLNYLDFTEIEPTDTWVKNYFEVDADRYPLTGVAIKLGAIKSTSMGCDIEYSECSVCANRAQTTLQYCDHINNHKNGRRIFSLADGLERIAYEKNAGLTFFEDSLLTVEPADPTADILQVHAAAGKHFDNATELLNLVRQEAGQHKDELSRTASESTSDWVERREELVKSAFRTSVAFPTNTTTSWSSIGASADTDVVIPSVTATPSPIVRPGDVDGDKSREKDEEDYSPDEEDSEVDEGADEETSDDESTEGPPQSPTVFSDIEGPFECPAVEFLINPEKCQGCKFNSEHNDMVACHHPEETNPEGRDPILYAEEYPSGGMSSTSVSRDGFELFTMAWNDKIWVMKEDTGDFTLYGQLEGPIDEVIDVLKVEADSEDFLKLSNAMFERPASRDADKEAVMPQINDRDRVKIVLSQLGRMSSQTRTALSRKLAEDSAEFDDPAFNVDDKGLTDPPPAPTNVLPDDNDDGTGVVDAEDAPSVEDEGVQVAIGGRKARQKASQPRRTARKGSPARPAARKVARPVKAAESPQQKQLAAMELVEHQVNLGQIDPSKKIPEIRRISSEMSMEQIQAQIQVYATIDTSAGRPLVPRQAQKTASSIVPSSRTLPSVGTSREDEALAALAAGV